MKLKLENENNLQDYIIVKVEKVSSETITLQLGGKNIFNRNWLQSLGAYIEIYNKPREVDGDVLIYRTEVRIEADILSVLQIELLHNDSVSIRVERLPRPYYSIRNGNRSVCPSLEHATGITD